MSHLYHRIMTSTATPRSVESSNRRLQQEEQKQARNGVSQSADGKRSASSSSLEDTFHSTAKTLIEELDDSSSSQLFVDSHTSSSSSNNQHPVSAVASLPQRMIMGVDSKRNLLCDWEDETFDKIWNSESGGEQENQSRRSFTKSASLLHLHPMRNKNNESPRAIGNDGGRSLAKLENTPVLKRRGRERQTTPPNNQTTSDQKLISSRRPKHDGDPICQPKNNSPIKQSTNKANPTVTVRNTQEKQPPTDTFDKSIKLERLPWEDELPSPDPASPSSSSSSSFSSLQPSPSFSPSSKRKEIESLRDQLQKYLNLMIESERSHIQTLERQIEDFRRDPRTHQHNNDFIAKQTTSYHGREEKQPSTPSMMRLPPRKILPMSQNYYPRTVESG